MSQIKADEREKVHAEQIAGIITEVEQTIIEEKTRASEATEDIARIKSEAQVKEQSYKEKIDKIAEYKQAQKQFKQQVAELTATNKQLQNKIAEHERVQKEVQQERQQLQQHIDSSILSSRKLN